MAFTAEDLFNSIDTIVGQRLSALSFDTTVIATIVDDSKKAQGHYVVSDGSIKFDAYTNDTNYKTDDQVRVTVLNGDWSQKKFIAGKYVDDETNMEPIHYTAPLGTTMNVSSTPLGTKKSWTLRTNNKALMQTNPVTIHIDADDTTLQVEGIYNVITLTTEVRTDMGAIGSIASGNYGILVEFVIQPAQGTTIKRFFTFDCSEMIGNPYAFVLDTHQEKKIVVPTIGHVTAINISAYQGLTYDDEGFAHPAPFVDQTGQEIKKQHKIIFTNTTIGFGSDLTAVEDNSLKLYTLDSATYQWNKGDGKNNTKRLGFVWYNKDDNDEYVGYSDGICDPGYDEIDYLKTKTLDSRLVAQQGKEVPNDEESLRLAANIAEAEPLMRKAYQALTTNVSQVLQRLDNQLVGATEIQEELAKLITGYTENQTSYEAKLSAAFTNAQNATDELVAFYKGVLKYGYYMSTQTTTEDDSDVWKSEWNDADPYTTFLNVFVAIKKDIADFFKIMEEKTAKDQVLSGYRPFYNDYKPKINTQLAIIDNYLDQIPITSNDATLLHGYENKTDYVKYDKDEEYWKQFANKYCVYWYRYNPHYLSTHIVPISEDEWNALAVKPTSHNTHTAYLSYIEQQNIEHKYGDFLGNYWERIKQNGNQVLKNYGVPYDINGDDVQDIVNGEPLPASPDEPIILKRTLDPTTDNESYQIVMFYNHEMIKSNVVTFTNTEAHLIPPDSKTDGGDKLLIEHDVDSRDHYQAYSSAYDLLNIRDGSLYRQIKCTYDGVLAGNEAMADAEIYWYVPINSTMITYDLAFLKNKGFNTDAELEVPTPYSKDGYIYFNRKIGYTEKMEDLLDSDGNPIYKDDGTKQQKSIVEITDADRFFFYKIKNFYEPSAQNNTILVEVYTPNKVEPTKGELTLTFGTFGTNGTKYTLAVVPAGTQTSLQPNGEEESGDLELKITLYNADGEALDLKTNFDGEFYSLSKEWYAKSAAAPELGELTQIVTAESNPEEAEQQTPQSSKSWLLAVPGTTGTNYDENRYIGIVKVSTTFEGGPENNPNEIELSALYAVPYSSSKDLYMSGPTTIVYNSQGTISRMSEEPYKLYQHKLVNRYLIDHELDNDAYIAFKASGEDDYEEYLHTQYPDATIELSYVDSYDEEVAGQQWELLYYQSNGSIAADPENTTRSYLDYMPILNSDNTLRPAPMYYDYKGATDEEYMFYIPVAQCKDENDNILWTQPIIIIQNRYESAMLNAWDGSLQIDEANGTIMSTMMGAGIKNKDNTFSGVLMGDIVAGADFDTSNANGIGLYGFHEGAQSFNFSVNGTAFLGKSGKGRIHFDGNNGFIYSTNWWNSFYNQEDDGKLVLIDTNNPPIKIDGSIGQGTNGLAIDLTNGHIDAYNFKLTSKNVIINSSEAATAYFIIKNNDSGNNLMYISPSEYYIQSDDFDPTEGNQVPGAGMKIDLETGHIHAFDFELESSNIIIDSYDNNGAGLIQFTGDSGNNNLCITNDPTKIPIQIGDSFKINWDGSIAGGSISPWSIDASGNAFFTNTTLSGDINVTGNIEVTGTGLIGGWKINGTKLESQNNANVYLEGDSTKSYAISIGTGGENGSAFKVTHAGYVTAQGLNLYSVNLYKGTINNSLHFATDTASIYGTNWEINNLEARFATLRITDGTVRLMGTTKMYFGETSFFYLSDNWVILSGADFKVGPQNVIEGYTIYATNLTGYAQYDDQGELTGETQAIDVTTALSCHSVVKANGFYTKNYKFGVWDGTGAGSGSLLCSVGTITLRGTEMNFGYTGDGLSSIIAFNGKVTFNKGIVLTSVYSSETNMEPVRSDTITVRTGGILSNASETLKFVNGILVASGTTGADTASTLSAEASFKIGGLSCTSITATTSQGEGTLTINISGTSPTLYQKSSGTALYYTRSNGETRYSADTTVRIYTSKASGLVSITYDEELDESLYTLEYGPYYRRNKDSGVYCYQTSPVTLDKYTAIDTVFAGEVILTEKEDTSS